MVSVTASVMATMALMVLWISTCVTLSSVLLRGDRLEVPFHPIIIE